MIFSTFSLKNKKICYFTIGLNFQSSSTSTGELSAMECLLGILLIVFVFVILPVLESGLVLIVIGGITYLMMKIPFLIMRYGLGYLFHLMNSHIPVLGRLLTIVLSTAVGFGMIAWLFLFFQLPLALLLFQSVSGE